ncbi:hypothetical protein [Nostoc linckia]|uniref:hypothetical protein n=1 Tax=Nostoc linckia TaxID=92942 RepID=UPI000BFFCDA3|nr:hypothetical protein [Nostoc linckia]PHJ95011.1 hypothetical protein VF09_36885 [Nostoc linckia z9]
MPDSEPASTHSEAYGIAPSSSPFELMDAGSSNRGLGRLPAYGVEGCDELAMLKFISAGFYPEVMYCIKY